MSEGADISLELFYPYGYAGRTMLAVRAPFAMQHEGPEIVGRVAVVAGRRYRICAIARQISGPIARGEPIGIEVEELAVGGEAA